MIYEDIALPNYNLHLIKTNKFRAITIRIVYTDIISKEEVTKRNMLTDLLIQSTKKYPTKRLLSLKAQDLYSANISSYNNRLGKYYNSNFTMSILNEKYTEKNNTEEAFKLLHEILYKPNITNCAFDEASFKIVYSSIETEIKTVKENSKRYANSKMLEFMGENEAYGIKTEGYLEELKKIDAKVMYEYYLNNLNNLKDIYVLGDFDISEMKKIIEKYFKVAKKKDLEDLYISHSISEETRVYKEKEVDNNQSKLSIGCKIAPLKYQEREYILPLFNMILGGGADSKFFKNIREKMSLCYYINSSCNKIDNIMAISSGISLNNYDTVLDLIKTEMMNMVKGNFTKQDLDNAKKLFISILDEVYDVPQLIIDAHYATVILGTKDIKTRKEEILKVTKKEIELVASKVKMDTIFLLEGK